MQGDDPEAAAAGSEAAAGTGEAAPPAPGAAGDHDDYHFETRQINVIAKDREFLIRVWKFNTVWSVYLRTRFC